MIDDTSPIFHGALGELLERPASGGNRLVNAVKYAVSPGEAAIVRVWCPADLGQHLRYHTADKFFAELHDTRLLSDFRFSV